MCGGTIGRPIYEVNVVFPCPNGGLEPPQSRSRGGLTADFASWWGVAMSSSVTSGVWYRKLRAILVKNDILGTSVSVASVVFGLSKSAHP